jgi:serine protease Do
MPDIYKKIKTMKLKQILLIVGISALSAVTSVWIYGKAVRSKNTPFTQTTDGKTPVNYAGFFDGATGAGEPIDFTKASAAAVPAVVHIKTRIPAKKISNQLPRGGGNMDELFERFFGDDMGGMFGPQMQPEQRASGSGVIISEDGYIVTNNHVISDGGQGVADEITVTLHNKKTYKAKVIGKDPSSDLAVLKIDGTALPFLLFGNSDNVKLGQWVLAVGYPLNLETTVTAGIVSAKGRSIGINSRQSQTPIESFIQTDAAINQGNSGGALISTDGQLIGINSAINGGYTGTYIGYGFAIPVNIVKKIVNDLIQFGDVKRGFLGISYPNLESENEKLVKQNGQAEGLGVYVSTVNPGGAAYNSGLKKGDVITKVNDNPVSTGAEMSAQVASYKPGDKIVITYLRGGKQLSASITLKESAGDISAAATNNLNEILGADLANIDAKIATANNVEGGVKVKDIKKGGPLSKTRMEKDFIITSVNGAEVKNLNDMAKVIAASDGSSITLDGFYEGYEGMYRYPVKIQ